MKSTEDKRFIVEQKTGYTPEIGRLLSMMDYVRLTTLDEVVDLTPHELDYRIEGRGNSIGCLLYHMACVEEVYQIMTFDNRQPTEEELEKLEAGLGLGEKAHGQIHGKKIEFYKDRLSLVREQTLERFKQKDDAWLDERSPFGPNHLANNYFRWFHVFEDELNHRGQIRLIRKHVKREQEG